MRLDSATYSQSSRKSIPMGRLSPSSRVSTASGCPSPSASRRSSTISPAWGRLTSRSPAGVKRRNRARGRSAAYSCRLKPSGSCSRCCTLPAVTPGPPRPVMTLRTMRRLLLSMVPLISSATGTAASSSTIINKPVSTLRKVRSSSSRAPARDGDYSIADGAGISRPAAGLGRPFFDLDGVATRKQSRWKRGRHPPDQGSRATRMPIATMPMPSTRNTSE